MKNVILILLFPFSLMAKEDICFSFENESAPSTALMPLTTPSGDVLINAVIHVIHHQSIPESNLPLDVVTESIDLLNADLAEANIQVNLSGVMYHDLAEYLLVESYLDGSMCFPAFNTQGELNHFASQYTYDRFHYLNIYVHPRTCGSNLGFAYLYPTATNLADGVWVKTSAFGGSGEHLQAHRDLNRTLTHEFGHYAGLYHVFQGIDNCGEVVDDCEATQDRVCDTAPTKVNASCVNPTCPPAWNPIRPWADYQHNNHMDYYVDSCRYHFTPGQVDRMHWYLNSFRSSAVNYEPCSNDISGDNVVGVDEILAVLNCWGFDCADLTGDDFTGVLDLNEILSQYGNDCNFFVQ